MRVTAAIVLALVVQDTKPEDELPGEVVRIFGSFERQTPKSWERVPVPGEKPVEWLPRQTWRADPSRPAQLRLSNGVRMDLQSASEVSLSRTKSRYRFHLTKGECLFDIGFTSGKAPDEAIEVVLPNGEVIVPASTKAFVRVVCRLDKEKDHVAVLNGAVTIKTKDEQVEVKQGEGLVVDPKGGGLKPKKEDVLTQAAWTRWEEKQRARGNLLKDGDMESPKTADWVANNATVTKDLREVHEGRQSLKITVASDGQNAWVYQDARVAAGARVRITGWVKSKGRVVGVKAASSGGAVSVGLDTPAAVYGGGWAYYEHEVQMPADKSVCRIVLACPTGSWITWDSLIVTEEK